MKTRSFLALSLFAAIFWLSNCQQNAEKPQTVEANISKEAQVKRGEYLVSFAMCDDCHTPKVMTPEGPKFDMSRRFSGHRSDEPFDSDADKKKLVTEQHIAIFSPGLTAAVGPWGVSYAANLTPDDTGIGNWTEAQFMKAIREGKSKGMDGTRPLLPPMPWEVVRNMSDEDLKAVFAYLKSVKPVKNVVPNPRPL